jgi:glutaconate CoA-transferase subunit B
LVAYADDYTLPELMCVQAARELRGAGVVMLGMGLPVIAGTLARLHSAPDISAATEVGVFDWAPAIDDVTRAPIGIADMNLHYGAGMVSDMVDALGCMVMGGNTDTAFLAAAQIDKYGNLNTLGMGDYYDMERRLGGTGGNTDAACLSKRLISVMSQENRRFVERVDFLTSPCYIDGPGGRRRAGLDPQGPNIVVSTMGVYGFDTEDGGETGSCEMVLRKVFPNIDAAVVRAMTGWDLRVEAKLEEVDPPTVEELSLLRKLDPLSFYLREGRY